MIRTDLETRLIWLKSNWARHREEGRDRVAANHLAVAAGLAYTNFNSGFGVHTRNHRASPAGLSARFLLLETIWPTLSPKLPSTVGWPKL